MLVDVNATKRKRIEEILRNPTYLPESGVYRRLEDRLMNLSKDDLGCLEIIIKLQRDEERKNKHGPQADTETPGEKAEG